MRDVAPYDVLDIARYIINKSIELGYPTTNLKLQKLLYYTQLTFLLERGKLCFEDTLVNWRHGPVVRAVYDEYRIYQEREISGVQTEYTELVVKDSLQLVHRTKEFDPSVICRDDRSLIDQLVESYSEYESWDMVEKIHREGVIDVEDVVSQLVIDKAIKSAKEMGIEVLSPEDEDYQGYHTIAGEKIDLDDVFEKMRRSGDIK